MSRVLIQLAGFLPLLAAMAASPPLTAQMVERVPLTGATVAAALTGAGLHVEGSQIELPGALATTNTDPQLRVTGAELLPDGRLRVRLACRQAGECQPFMATLRSSGPEAMAGLLALRRSLQPPSAARSNGNTDRLIAGQHATLHLESTHMLITVPVVAIDSGAPGTEVRVSSLDRKQLYRAVVADAGTVRGALP